MNSRLSVPVLIFAAGRYTSGWRNIIVAHHSSLLSRFNLVTLLTNHLAKPTYQWRRDLLANMIGHLLVDFIGVIFVQSRRLAFALLYSLRSLPLLL